MEMMMPGKSDVMRLANSLVLAVPADRQRAADLFDAIRAMRKEAEKEKEERCRPLKTAWEDSKRQYDAFIKECEGNEAKLTSAMSAWDLEQERMRQIEQQKVQARIDAQNARAEVKAQEQGIEPVYKVAPIVQSQPKSITTQAGTVQTRVAHKVWHIGGLTNETIEKVAASDHRLVAIPRECLLVNVPMINAMVRVGLQPDCVSVTEDFRYVQRA